MFHFQNIVERPMQVISDISYLAGQLLLRVAYDSPGALAAPVPMSIWKS